MGWEQSQVFYRGAHGELIARAGFRHTDAPRFAIFGLEPEYYGFFYGYDPEWFVVDNNTSLIVQKGLKTVDEARRVAMELSGLENPPTTFDVETLAQELIAATAKFPRWSVCVERLRRCWDAS